MLHMAATLVDALGVAHEAAAPSAQEGTLSPRLHEALRCCGYLAVLVPVSLTTMQCIMHTAPTAVAVMQAVNPLLNAIARLPTSSDPEVCHHALLESVHPYSEAARDIATLAFPPHVSWLALHITGGLCQIEDTLTIYGDGDTGRTPLCEPLRGGVNFPKRALLIPGNRVHVELATASNYARLPEADRPGFQVSALGFGGAGPEGGDTVAGLEDALAHLAGEALVKSFPPPSRPGPLIDTLTLTLTLI